jgi:hypothetical protein
VEGTDDRILGWPKSWSDLDDEKILSSIWNQTTGSTVFTIQTILTVFELNKTSDIEVRKVRSIRVFQKYHNSQHSWVWWWCFVACVVRVTCVSIRTRGFTVVLR